MYKLTNQDRDALLWLLPRIGELEAQGLRKENEKRRARLALLKLKRQRPER